MIKPGLAERKAAEFNPWIVAKSAQELRPLLSA